MNKAVAESLPGPGNAGERRLRQLLLCLLLAAFGFSAAHLGPGLQDDAFISFTYARNLADGFGPVYNPGERVEGYSSPLYVGLLALLSLILPMGIPAIAVYLGLLAGLLTCYLVFRFAEQELHSPLAALLLLLPFALLPPLLAETMGGMETMLYVLAIVLLLVLEDRGSRWSWLVMAAVALLRPEGIFLVLGYLLARLLLRPGERKATWRLLSLVALVYVLFLAWRTLYYGELVANTFYVKTPFSLELLTQGLQSLWRFALRVPLLLLPAAAGAVFGRWKRAWPWLYAVLFYLVFIPYVGGGFKFTFRYYLYMVGPLFLLIIQLAARLRRRLPRLILAILLVWGVVAGVYHYHAFGRALGFHGMRKQVVRRQQELAGVLTGLYPPGTVMATGQAGAIKYYTRFITIDMLGLCDKHIARQPFDQRGVSLVGHLKGDGKYVLARNPDIILFHSVLFRKKPMNISQIRARVLSGKKFSAWLSELQIMQTPSFWLQYNMNRVQLSDCYSHFFVKGEIQAADREQSY